MLSVEAGGLTLTFCPGVTQSRSLTDVEQRASAHVQHAHHGGTQQGQSNGASDDSPCPFAMVGFASVGSLAAASTATAACDVSLPTYISHHSNFGPVRSDRARGPPEFPADILV